MPAGTTKAWLKGDGVWWVSWNVAAFKCCRSTVLRGVPSFLDTTTIFAHHIVGVPGGTGSIMPKRISWSKSVWTCFCPVIRHRYWAMESLWGCIWAEMYLHWLASHFREWLVITSVECTWWIIIQQPYFKLIPVFHSRRKREVIWPWGWWCVNWATIWCYHSYILWCCRICIVHVKHRFGMCLVWGCSGVEFPNPIGLSQIERTPWCSCSHTQLGVWPCL